MKTESVLSTVLRPAGVASAIALGSFFLGHKASNRPGSLPVLSKQPIASANAQSNMANALLPIDQSSIPKVDRTILLSGSKSYSGGTDVNSGTLVLNGASSLVAGSSFKVPSQESRSDDQKVPRTLLMPTSKSLGGEIVTMSVSVYKGAASLKNDAKATTAQYPSANFVPPPQAAPRSLIMGSSKSAPVMSPRDYEPHPLPPPPDDAQSTTPPQGNGQFQR